MKKLIPFILFLTSYYSLAQECKTIDLSGEGNVLHPLRATNQNGLGICHIEQLQRMLKAKLEGHPDLARISMAIHEKAKRDIHMASNKKKAVRWMDGKAGLPGGTYIDAGNSCEAFELLKGQEICESASDQFEQLSKNNAYDQKKILDALTMFYDERRAELDLEALMNGLPEGHHDYAFREAVSFCQDPSIETSAFIKEYKKAGGTSRDTDALKEFQVSTFIRTSGFEKYLSEILPDIDKLIEGNNSLQKLYAAQLKILKEQEECANKQFDGYLKLAGEVCAPISQNASRVISLKSLGFQYKDLYRFMNMIRDRDQYFMNASACSGKKHKIVDSLKCSTINLLSEHAKVEKDQAKYTEKFSSLVSGALETNTPVGISVCTRFFKNPGVKTIKEDGKYGCGDKTDPDFKSGEGSHAVTIIGKRCGKEGKTEFYIHNSWGNGCGYYAKEYECTKKGGFWVDAEILSMNARNLNILK